VIIALYGSAFYLLPRIGQYITPVFPPPGPVPPRTIQTANNLSLLWSREEYAIPRVESSGTLFFAMGEHTLVSPVANLSEKVYYLEAFDIVTGQTQWQTPIPSPHIIRFYDNKFFVFSGEWLDQAPTVDDQELPYCSFKEKNLSLSAYDVNSGQQIWRYGYRGANISRMFFLDQSVYLMGSHDHGVHQLLINIDSNSGDIIHQRCNGSAPPPRGSSGGTRSSTYNVTYTKIQGPDCDRHRPFCFVTEGNRLRVLTGSPLQTVAYIDFEGTALEPTDMDAAVNNNVIVVHLDDSDQLFAFRLP
jgi:hypothetical protein